VSTSIATHAARERHKSGHKRVSVYGPASISPGSQGITCLARIVRSQLRDKNNAPQKMRPVDRTKSLIPATAWATSTGATEPRC
jgi:hypothetical protein